MTYEVTPIRIAEAIPYGEKNAIGRAELARKIGVTDREMRQRIAEARAEGEMILCRADGGYFRSDDLAQIAVQYRREKARMKSLYRAMKPMRDLLKRAGRDV